MKGSKTVLTFVACLCWSTTLCSAAIVNRARLTDALDSNKDGRVSRAEVTSFYETFPVTGGSVSRCDFTQKLTTQFQGSSSDVIALFDVLQTNDPNTLSETEFAVAILGAANADSADVTDVQESLGNYENRVNEALTQSHQETQGANPMKYTDFKVNLFADQTDTDNDGIVSTSEISTAMKSFDSNGDHGIWQCEFVDEMRSRFTQHPLSANVLYDILFRSRDVTWAPVDSEFLHYVIDDNRNGVVTKEEFIAYFSQQNEIASGVVEQFEDRHLGDGSGDGAMSLTFSLGLFLTSLLTHHLLARP